MFTTSGLLVRYFGLRCFHMSYKTLHPVPVKIRKIPSTLKKSCLYKHGYENSTFNDKKQFSTSKRSLCSVYNVTIDQAVIQEEWRKYLEVYPDIVSDLKEAYQEPELSDATNWYTKSLWYNQTDGLSPAGIEMVIAYRFLAPPEKLTSQNIRDAQIIGWCYQLEQVNNTIVDDIVDGADIRWQKTCWYRKADVGTHAINDANLILSGVYYLLHKHFHDKPFYLQILDMFRELTLKIALGQALEFLTAYSPGKDNLENFTKERYSAIIRYKTVPYLIAPIINAMYMAGIVDEELHKKVRELFDEIAKLWQSQNDYVDCYRDSTFLGKSLTDIQKGKCTWLAVTALENCTAEQRSIMKECYGSSDPDKVEAVKHLYDQLNLPKLFKTNEENSYNLIIKHIQQLPTNLKPEIFYYLIEKLYILTHGNSKRLFIHK